MWKARKFSVSLLCLVYASFPRVAFALIIVCTDEYGNVVGTKKVIAKRKKPAESETKKKGGKKEEKQEDDDGKYFEADAKGNLKLKEGKKKIDISKLSKDDLKKMGIDTEVLSKADLMRTLKEKFGDALEVVDHGKKIGTKKLEDYGYVPTIAELIADDDLDVSTRKCCRNLENLNRN